MGAAPDRRRHRRPGEKDLTDVVELVLAGQQRISFLRQALCHAGHLAGGENSGSALATVWDQLADLITVQAAAAKEICYLPMVAVSSWSREQMGEAVAAFDGICEAVADARLKPVGSRSWWQVVEAALSAVAEHFSRQREGVLADFRGRADRSLRRRLGGQWSAFTAARIRDLAADGQVGDAACQLCRWPLPAIHHHVLDTKDCAVFCACPCCYELYRWAARDRLSGTA